MSLPLVVQEEKTCITNLDRCGALCCQRLAFNLDPIKMSLVKRGVPLRIHRTMTPDMRLYYELHNCLITGRDTIEVPINPGEYEIIGNKLVVFQRCKWLTTELRCKMHGTKHKPRVCRELNYDTKDLDRIHLTPNCIYGEAK